MINYDYNLTKKYSPQTQKSTPRKQQLPTTRCHCGPMAPLRPPSSDPHQPHCFLEDLGDKSFNGDAHTAMSKLQYSMCGRGICSHYYSEHVSFPPPTSLAPPSFPPSLSNTLKPQQCPAAGGSEITAHSRAAGAELHTLCYI